MCITKACEEPTSAGVWWRDDAEWKKYNATQAAAILQGVKEGATRLELGNLVSPKYGGGTRYVVDLTTMKQINLASGYTRDVKVVHAPANAPADVPATAVTDVIKHNVMKELRAVPKLFVITAQFLLEGSIQILKKVVENLLTVTDQAMTKEQVKFQQTLPKQTTQGAEVALGGPQAVEVDWESDSPCVMSYYRNNTRSDDDYYCRDNTSSDDDYYCRDNTSSDDDYHCHDNTSSDYDY